MSLQLQSDGPIVRVTLNRPEVRNAFNEQLIAELTAWAESVKVTGPARVAVLSGAGKMFCAGADLTWMSKMVAYTRDENVRDARAMARMFEALDRLPIPLIGRVHGAALGGGVGLAAVCDIVVAAEDAAFAFTEVKLGILPAVISPYALAKIGPSAARELFLTGARFSAERAKEIGLVHAVGDEQELDRMIAKYVNDLLTSAPEAVAAAKALIAHVSCSHGTSADRVHDRRDCRSARLARRPGRHGRLSREAPPLMDIKRVLVANRGEIALRVIRACRELGIETAAVYSDADATARHVRAADIAVRIGPAPAAESYLNIGALIDAARSSGADAVHPGYGFLSERAAFARACVDAGLIFIGPPADAIERMGSKIGARGLIEKAGVPVVPGRTPADQGDSGIAAAAREIGFPVLVKASAGGGGKGMRAAADERALSEAIPAARREAQAAFGDGTLYVERLIERPRHVEIQIFADSHGNAVHLFERECSVQRRHQKIIEESPSPALTPSLRDRMGEAAVAAARQRWIPQRRHDRIPARGHGRRGDVLFPGDEHAAAGRASRDGGRHRHRSRARATDGRVGTAAAVAPGRSRAARARHRMPRLCRGSGAGLPAAGGSAAALPRADGTWHPGRQRRRGRRRRFRSTTIRCWRS